MRGLSVLSRALRWALVGMTFSMLSNAIFEGSVIPSILIVGLPAWVIAFRKTFNLVIDFASPVSAWIVQRFGSFRSLATTEAWKAYCAWRSRWCPTVGRIGSGCCWPCHVCC